MGVTVSKDDGVEAESGCDGQSGRSLAIKKTASQSMSKIGCGVRGCAAVFGAWGEDVENGVMEVGVCRCGGRKWM